MEFLVKIDRASIRENPDKGEPWLVPIRRDFELSVTGAYCNPVLVNYFNKLGLRLIRMHNMYGGDGSAQWRADFVGIDQDVEKIQAICEKAGVQLHWTMRQDYERIERIGRPCPWLFNYLPTQVKCKHCEAEFNYTDLEHDEYEWGDCNYSHSHEVCPHCKEWDCCTLDYEDIYEVMSK